MISKLTNKIMVFSDTTNKNGIVQYTESLCRLGDGGITNDTTLFKQITGYLNQAYKKVSMALLRVDRRWKFDDTNYTDFPIATIDLVSNQRDYTLPASTSGGNASTLWKVNLVEILDINGNYNKIDIMPDGELETTDTGVPAKYKVIGNSIRLQNIPLSGSVTLTAGLRITFQRSIVEFTTASTTVQPGFFDSYHDLLAYDASASYLMPINTQLAINYSQIFENRLKLLQKDYSNKNDDVEYVISPVTIYSE
jgi:hypothetical protein